MCIIRTMMAIAWGNELQFQRLFEHHPFYEKNPHVKKNLAWHLWWKIMWMMKCPWNPQNSNSFWWGVEVKQQTKGWPCYKFLWLDKKTYHIEFGFKMFIRKWYNWKGTYDMEVIRINGNRLKKNEMTNCRTWHLKVG